MRRVRPLLVALLLGLVGQASAAPQESDAATAIRAVRESSNQAIAAHDIRALPGTWVDDVHVTAGAGTLIEGSDAMADAFASSFADPQFVTYRRTPNSITVSEGGGRAAEAGKWVGTWHKADGEMNVRGVYLAQWVQRDGTWRIRSEVFVTLTCEGSTECDIR